MVTKEQVQQIAQLSKLYVSQEELDDLTVQMQKMVAFAGQISAAGEELGEFDSISGLSNVFREDEVVPSFDRDEILKNVDGGEDGCFLVKKRG